MSDHQRPPTIIKHGDFYRGDSYISEDAVQPRFGVLLDTAFSTKRTSKSKHTKVWKLQPKCEVFPTTVRTLKILKESSNTFLSLANRDYNEHKLYTFTVTFPSRLSKKPLLLAFNTAEEATSWHHAFETAIGALKRQLRPASSSSRKSIKKELKYQAFEARGGAVSAPAERLIETGDGPPPADLCRRRSVTISTMSADDEDDAFSDAGDCGGAVEAGWLSDEDGFYPPVEASVTLSPEQTMGRRSTEEDFSMPEQVHTNSGRDKWTPYRVLNGLAVYKEAEDEAGNGGAYMVSGTMKSTPVVCCKALMDMSFRQCNIWAFSAIQEVEMLDKYSQVFRVVMQPQGTMQRFLVPRELVLKRVWRRDADGTFNVLMQSIDHRACPPTPGMVRAHISAMCFTIAPLKVEKKAGISIRTPSEDMDADEQSRADASVPGECLVTVVLKIDLGGCFARNSWSRHLLLFIESWERWWIESLLMTVVALRDKVEQDRFVVLPLNVRHPVVHRALSLETRTTEAPTATVQSRTTNYRQPEQPVRRPSPSTESTASPAGGEQAPGLRSDGDSGGACGERRDLSHLSQHLSQHIHPVPKPSLDARFWSCPGAKGFKVRGPQYLSDRKKVASAPPVFSLQGVELVKMPLKETVYHVARYLPIVRHSTAPFNFVICLTLPYSGQTLGLVIVFAADALPSSIGDDGEDDDDDEVLPPFHLTMARFLAGTDELRDMKLKLIPSLAEGSWIVRQAVGQTPVMLGKRLKSVYYQEDGYIEADIDIGANSTAAHITSLVAGAIKSLVFDIGIVLEGQQTNELPERLLGSVRLDHLDLTAAIELDTTAELTPVPRDRPTPISPSSWFAD